MEVARYCPFHVRGGPTRIIWGWGTVKKGSKHGPNFRSATPPVIVAAALAAERGAVVVAPLAALAALAGPAGATDCGPLLPMVKIKLRTYREYSKYRENPEYLPHLAPIPPHALCLAALAALAALAGATRTTSAPASTAKNWVCAYMLHMHPPPQVQTPPLLVGRNMWSPMVGEHRWGSAQIVRLNKSTVKMVKKEVPKWVDAGGAGEGARRL